MKKDKQLCLPWNKVAVYREFGILGLRERDWVVYRINFGFFMFQRGNANISTNNVENIHRVWGQSTMIMSTGLLA